MSIRSEIRGGSHSTLSSWMKGFILILLFTAFQSALSAQTIIGWDPMGLSQFGPSPWAVVQADPNLTVTGLTRGSGVTTSGTGATGGWGGTGFVFASAPLAIAANVFVTFSLKANPGYQVSLETFDLNYRRSSTGPPSGLLQYSRGNVGFTDISTLVFPSITGAAIPQIDLSQIAALQYIPGGTIITFRIIPLGATSATGTWYVFNVISADNDLKVAGTIEAYTHEPSGNATGFLATIASPEHRTITLHWKEIPGTTATDQYLIKGNTSGYDLITVPVDGTPVPNGTLTTNLPEGTESCTFSGLNPSTIYYFKIFPYTNTGVSINYKTGGIIPQTTAITSSLPTATLPDPLSCFQASAMNSGTNKWVTGYIIGTVSGSNSVQLTGPFSISNNLALADDPFEVNLAKIIFVQLNDAIIIQNLRLDSNSSNYHKKIIIHGDLAPVFLHPGMQNTNDYKWFDPIYSQKEGRWNGSDSWFTGIPYKHDEVHIYSPVNLDDEGWSDDLLIHPSGKITIDLNKILNIGGNVLIRE